MSKGKNVIFEIRKCLDDLKWRSRDNKSEKLTFSEIQSQHIEVFSTVPEGGQNVTVDLSITQVVHIDEHDTVCMFSHFCARLSMRLGMRLGMRLRMRFAKFEGLKGVR